MNEIDYCRGCIIKYGCKETYPESCEIYQNHKKVIKIVENISEEERDEIKKHSLSFLQGIKKMNKLVVNLEKDIMNKNDNRKHPTN